MGFLRMNTKQEEAHGRGVRWWHWAPRKAHTYTRHLPPGRQEVQHPGSGAQSPRSSAAVFPDSWETIGRLVSLVKGPGILRAIVMPTQSRSLGQPSWLGLDEDASKSKVLGGVKSMEKFHFSFYFVTWGTTDLVILSVDHINALWTVEKEIK